MSLFTEEQLTRLQSEVQQELERREWAESGDAVMAEYICVLLGNGNPRDRVKSEMEDLVGTDFDTPFLDWLFERRDALREVSSTQPAPESTPAVPTAPAPATVEHSGPKAASRMFASAIEGTKRKADPAPEESNKRRLPDGPLGAPNGPHSMHGPGRPNGNGPHGSVGRSLVDRLAPRGGPLPQQRGSLNVRGASGPSRLAAGQQMPFRPPMGGNFPQHHQQQNFMPGQEEMMMQMMAMQANMMQMAAQMQQMQEKTQNPPSRPIRTPGTVPSKVPAGTKLGGHTVSAIQPRAGPLGTIPDKPTSTALCKFGVGCSNARCTYSHPSSVADEKTGMVLSEEACEAGKNCKDAECVKSHVSPAAILGETAGPNRVLCKFQHCTNPTCQFRHEDEDGNFIPPPALKGKTSVPNAKGPQSSDDGEIEVSVKAHIGLDTALADGKTERPCRYAERCTRVDCKFTHPASRPTLRGGKPARSGALPFSKRGAISSGEAIVGGMGKSTKFGNTATTESSTKPLNPAAGEFKPAGSAATDVDLEVTS